MGALRDDGGDSGCEGGGVWGRLRDKNSKRADEMSKVGSGWGIGVRCYRDTRRVQGWAWTGLEHEFNPVCWLFTVQTMSRRLFGTSDCEGILGPNTLLSNNETLTHLIL